MRTRSAILLVLALAGCAQLPERPDLMEQTASKAAIQGSLADRIAPAEARHPGQSGFRLVSTGTEAYALRAFSAQAASSSLDIQTYIWHADLTGKLLARQALVAADRGVKVRILVDDLDARAKNAGFAALDAHPQVEVRLYNPLATREGKLRKMTEFSAGFGRLNHRMHNKSWIADNRIALVGGRNLGDEYFDAHEGVNFVDLDLVMAGPVVREVSASFDRFWNSPTNYPIGVLDPESVTPEALVTLRAGLDRADAELKDSPYARILREDPQVQDIVSGDTRLHWTPVWTFVSDAPDKASLPEAERSAVHATVVPALNASRSDVRLISPYFVPGEQGTQNLVAAVSRGLTVSILTNSLAATDVAAVHGGYMRYRPALLQGGVQLWELKSLPGSAQEFSLFGSSGSSLHTKAAIMDDRQVFVGSYNIDPRSRSLNCEQGLLVTHPEIARELIDIFKAQLSGERAWQLSSDADGSLQWSDGSARFEKEPDASAGRRFQAWLMKLLPIENQL